jgi:hypothetical protein
MFDFESIENKDILWITLINYGYLHYTKNFMKSMELRNINLQLYVFCLDDQTYNELKEHKQCKCIKADFLKSKYSTEMKHWGDLEYKRIVFAKLDAILYTLQKTYEMGVKNIGYIDTDIVLFSDPSIIMMDKVHRHPKIDVFSQCDEEGTQCSSHSNCKNICSGVIVFRNKPSLYSLFEYKEQDIKHNASDQHFLRQQFKNQSIQYMTIEKSIMPNGSYYPDFKKKKIVFPQSVCLVHYNWMIGNEKIETMKMHNVWYI